MTCRLPSHPRGEVQDKGAIAEEFSQFFATCVSGDNRVQGPLPAAAKASGKFLLESVEEQLTLDLLKDLKPDKATGADGISPRILKTMAVGIAGSLTQLFNYSLRTGEIPSEWKMANVTPVLKKGSRVDINNYRPVSVLPTVAKVFERIVHRQLYSYLEENQLLHQEQSGFRPHHSTMDALLKVTTTSEKHLTLMSWWGQCI